MRKLKHHELRLFEEDGFFGMEERRGSQREHG